MVKTIVCMKVVPKTEAVTFNPVTKTLDRSRAENEINPADKNALELALQLKDKHGGTVTLLSMGPPFFEPFLKTAMAMGADEAVLLSDPLFGGADTYPTSFTLASAIRKLGAFDLILCGEESSDASTGQVPPGIAEWLGIPQITYVSTLEITADGEACGTRTIKGGHEVIETPLPALVTVELGVNNPRFPDFRRKRWVETQYELPIWKLTDLGLAPEQVGKQGSQTIVAELVEVAPPARRREFLSGTPEEIARQLLERVRDVLKPG